MCCSGCLGLKYCFKAEEGWRTATRKVRRTDNLFYERGLQEVNLSNIASQRLRGYIIILSNYMHRVDIRKRG